MTATSTTARPATPLRPRARTGVRGLHPVGVGTADAGPAADFYGRIVGLRDLGVGTAPHADRSAPGAIGEVRARYFGDQAGHAGSLIALQEHPGAPRGAPGM